MSRKEVIKSVSLNGVEIKNKIERSIAYDHEKLKNLDIPFSMKENPDFKLPFSDFKIAVARELMEREALIENLNKLLTYRYQEAEYQRKLAEYNEYMKTKAEIDKTLLTNQPEEEIYEVITEEPVTQDEVEPVIIPAPVLEDNKEEEPAVSVVESKVEKEKVRKKSTTITLKADTKKVIEKIKAEAIAKNEGKKVIGRREINLMLEKQRARKNKKIINTSTLEDKTSIDIYLTAINKLKEVEKEKL